jgi:hypothetical protein
MLNVLRQTCWSEDREGAEGALPSLGLTASTCRPARGQVGITYTAEPRPFPDGRSPALRTGRPLIRADGTPTTRQNVQPPRKRCPGEFGIPEFEFLSNGLWTVNAREVRQALDALWRDWLRETTEHGGFTVTWQAAARTALLQVRADDVPGA